MGKILNISEAASLALHTMVLLSGRESEQLTTKEIASKLGGSEFHLAKIMQRLTRAGFVTALRGPKGGFRLRRPSNSITLLNVFEAIEGRFDPSDCLAGAPVCSDGKCILGNLLESINSQVRSYLGRTRLSDIDSFRENQMF